MTDQQAAEPLFGDALFRQKRKKGKFRTVNPPRLESAVADTHAHVHLLPDPALALAQCAVWGVEFVCDIVDIQEDDAPAVFAHLREWPHEAQARLADVIERSEESLAAMAGGAPAAGGDAQGVAGDDPVPANAAALGGLPGCVGSTDPASPAAVSGCGALPPGALTHLPDKADPAAFALPADAANRPIPHLRIAVGCHPHNAKFYDDALEAQLMRQLADPRVCAVGEIGLDYHYDLSPRDAQREAFRRQIRIAHATGLPVALHVREAHDEAFRILQEEGFPEGGTLLHCFDLDWATVAPWVEVGCFIALGGALTFGRCEDTREAVARIPERQLLTETDSPYMTPEPMRGMTCGPAHTVFTAARMAEVLGCDAGAQRDRLLRELMANARGLLDREPTAWQREQGKERSE